MNQEQAMEIIKNYLAMNCSRSGCDEPMCDTYIQDVGYICNGCKSDFYTHCEELGIDPDNEHDIKDELKTFMKKI